MVRCSLAKGRAGRIESSTSGKMQMKARIWWGVLKALDCAASGLCSEVVRGGTYAVVLVRRADA